MNKKTFIILSFLMAVGAMTTPIVTMAANANGDSNKSPVAAQRPNSNDNSSNDYDLRDRGGSNGDSVTDEGSNDFRDDNSGDNAE